MSSVSGAVKSIQDIMRKDVGVDGDAQRISQMVWMIFLKIYDDREEELELTEPDFRSPIPERYRWRNWAADREGITGEALVKFVDDLFVALKSHLPTTGDVGKRAKVVRDVFEDTYNYMKSGTLMRQVINKINEIDFNNTADRHTFGAIYEQILKDLQSAGNAGEFYTPRAVTRFIIDRLAPRLDEPVFDPACGTGGFLACTIDHKRQFVKTPEDEAMLQSTIRGVEKKALPHMLCVTNMILHGLDTPSGIVHGNTLEKPYREYGERDRVPVIATNPPFGGMEQDGIEQNFPAALRTRETADLFMALIIKLLKQGGRAGVVLPDGFLFGEGVKTTLKRTLLEECNLHTIVRLPNGVFNPYTGIKTNVLFFTKGTPTKHVWFYEHPFPPGVASYNKTRPMRFEEFASEQEWWGDEADGFAARRETEQAWKICAEDVAARGYNLDLKNPHTPESESHDPDELLTRYAAQQAETQSIRNRLKEILADALADGMIKNIPALVCESLDIWTSAIDRKSGAGNGKRGSLYGIERLRALIFELAARGKLVNGENVHLEKLGGFVELVMGQAPPGSACNKDGLGTIFVKTGEFGDLYPEVCEWTTKPLKLAKQGDVLICVVGATIGKLNLAIDCAIGRSVAAIRPKDGLETRYLYYALMPYTLRLRGGARGSAQGVIGKSELNAVLIRVPSTAEQQRIVAKVEELMALCDALEANTEITEATQRALADAIVETTTA